MNGVRNPSDAANEPPTIGAIALATEDTLESTP